MGDRSSYSYIKRAYGVDPVVGARVQHTVTEEFGAIAREDKGQSHRVMVRLDGKKFALPCHPTELDYAPVEPSHDPNTSHANAAGAIRPQRS